MDMRPYILFCCALLFLFFGLLIYLKSKNKVVSKVFNLFVLSFAVWSFGLAMFFHCDLKAALFWAKFLYFSASFIPPSFVLFSFIFPRMESASLKKINFLLFAPNILFFYLYFFTPLIIKDVFVEGGVRGFIYGNLRYIWDFQFNALLIYGFVRYIKMFRNSNGITREQLRYLIIGDMYIYIFAGLPNVLLPLFSVFSFIWLGPIISIFWILLISYTIVKYNLLDIKIIISRATTFVIVYSFVLGIPFALAFGWRAKLLGLFGENWWMVPLITSTVLATVGPFIYVFVQKRAEDRLFQEQRRYQSTLRQASSGMGKIKDLKRLVTLIVHIMTKTVRVDFSMVFLNDQHAKKFRIAAFRSSRARMKFRSDLIHESAVVQFLQETQNPIVYDEIKQRTQDYGDLKLARLETELKAMEAALVVPSFIDAKLVAILVMGNKLSGKTYSSDDLSVFSILANQSALAIENAQFYDEMKSTHVQLLKAEKMATIGTLADGLSHQINNRLHAMGFIAGDALDTLKLGQNLQMSLEVKEMVLDLEHALNRIESNVQQGGEIVQGLLKYTRKGDEGFSQVGLDKLIEAALEMTQFKIKPGEMAINHEYPNDLPKIHGNFTQLQEVFFNLIDNAYDAMMQRKVELKEPDYHPTIKITAKGSVGHMEIIVEDNGIGIQEQDKEKIFTPFFTTKLSSKKGTGLGLYVIQRLIEENHKGKVVYESKYKQGTTVHLTLPAA